MPSSSSVESCWIDNWALTASYVWSRLYGNYSGLSESDENGRTEPNIGATFDSAARVVRWRGSSTLRTAGDRPSSPGQGAVHLHRAVWHRRRRLPVAGQRPAREPFRRADARRRSAFYAGRGSDGRTPAVSQTDLNVQDTIRLGGRKGQRLTLGLNVLNVFNQARGVSRFSFETDPGVQSQSRSMRLTTMRDVPTWARQSTSRKRDAILASFSTSSFRSHARLE